MTTPAPTNYDRIVRRHARRIAPLRSQERKATMLLPDVRTVIFDIYGTLFVSNTGDAGPVPEEQAQEAIFQAAFKAVGVQVAPSVQDLSKRFYQFYRENLKLRQSEGVDFPEVEILDVWQVLVSSLAFERVLTQLPKEIDLEALAVEYESRSNPVWPMPGLKPTIARLKRRGFQLGLVAEGQFYTPLLFPALLGKTPEKLGFDPSLIISTHQEREAKPSLSFFKQLARHVNPTTALVVGNHLHDDIWPASKLGFRTALFAGDGRSVRWQDVVQEWDVVHPDVVITALPQLLECLPKKALV